MRNRVHYISFLGCLSVLGFLLVEWIVAVLKHAAVSQIEVFGGFCLAWAFAICHHWTKPRSPITTRQSGRLRHVLHRSSFVLCLVCIGMLPVGFLISATERGQLIEHHYCSVTIKSSGCVPLHRSPRRRSVFSFLMRDRALRDRGRSCSGTLILDRDKALQRMCQLCHPLRVDLLFHSASHTKDNQIEFRNV